MRGKRHVVAVAVTDGAPTFELAVPCEVFGTDRSDIVAPWYELRLCAAEPGPIRTSAGLRLDTCYSLDDLVDADTVVVAASSRRVQTTPPQPLVDAVRTAHERGRRIVALCNGSYVLAAAGLLDGRRATTHWMNGLDLADRFPSIGYDPTVLYVGDDTVFTSAGTGASIDLCLHLVRHDHGSAVANEVARRMVVPPHREGGQAQHSRPLTPLPEDSGLGTVLEWARERLHEPLTVALLAREAHVSERTLARRFRETLGVTPLRWILQERIRLAQELLETTDEPVESIARRTGFGTPANLRHHFGRLTSTSPRAYRNRFRSRSPGHAPCDSAPEPGGL
ncbi:GlxA family transcriptional regulator [Streptomyces sp. NPDC059176]|uniref:GlxA family transcriptional regulator n=1 Tax=unclassified Streptomyces TaxID=2593676 RepID=UPI0036A27CCF